MPFFFMEAKLIEGTGTTISIDATHMTSLAAAQVQALTDAKIAYTDGTALVNVAAPGGDKLGAILAAFPAGAITTGTADVFVMGGDVTMTAAIYSGVVNPFIGLAGHTEGALGIALLYVLLISFF